MSFKLDDNEERIIKGWPIVISKPVDGGKVQKHEVTADFLLLQQDDLDDLITSSRESGGAVDADMLRRVVVSLGQFSDAEGNPIDFSSELLERILKISYIRTAIAQAYWSANAGNKAQRKN